MDNFNEYYAKLNSSQKDAADALKGPLLVLAGPGTGKTELLSVRAANIIHSKQANPENILILTYTNAASRAMKERLVKILGPHGYDIETGTFHSFSNSILLDSEEAAGYVQDKIQITDIERVKAFEYILDHTDGIDSIRPFRAPYIYRNAIESKISELKKEGISPKEFEKIAATLEPDGVHLEAKHLPRIKALAFVYKLYEEYKAGKNVDLFDDRGRYDFDDMIIFALEAIKKERGLKDSLRDKYKFIMVDEFQDTNGAQLDLLFELAKSNSPNLCCVGDDDQSIYRFQGASVGNFKLLKTRFPGLKTVSLKDNYRSTKNIIMISDKIIGNLPDTERMTLKELTPKKDYNDKIVEFHELTTESEELIFLANKVKEIKDRIISSSEISDDDKARPYNNIAILVRKRKDILKIIDTFLKAGIPYSTDGKEDIAPEKRVRQMLDVLALADTRNITALSDKDALLYRVLISDYFQIPMRDILEFIRHLQHKRARNKEDRLSQTITLFQEFLSCFDSLDTKANLLKKDIQSLPICKSLSFKDPYSIARAAWVIRRMLEGINTRPVHAVLLQYVEDAGIFKYILKVYNDDSLLRIRDLRALTSFINMIKVSDLNSPALTLFDLIDELDTKREHGIPIQGDLVTMSQDGVRIFTAHGSKGLEFHSVIIPFCLQDKNWPMRLKSDLIPLPPEIFKTKGKVCEKNEVKALNFYDETRLFYVASTRAKANLLYTASPKPGTISSSYLPLVGLESVASESLADEEIVLASALTSTSKKDPFIGTEAILKDMISNLTLNPTSLNNYINCKRKFLYTDVLRLPSQKRLGLTFGNCVHKGLEEVYRCFMSNDKFPGFNFFKTAFLDELKYQGVEKSIELSCCRQVDTLRGWFKAESLAPVKPVGLEKKLVIMLDDDLIFTGKYDKTELVNGKSHHLRVVDYKTGKPDEHIKNMISKTKALADSDCEGYFRQLVAYKLLFDRDSSAKNNVVIEGLLVFVEPAKLSVIKYGLKKGEFINKLVPISEGKVSELEAVIRGCWKSIKSLDFSKLKEYDDSVKKCGRCDYKNICWQ
ncbi:MAG: ATP-dependent DNA helicase [Candidatus Orphnella occulta]|nr:ATP-dependent DNA helicase [Candidatus Orphnella occulta]